MNVDENKNFSDDLVQLARLGLAERAAEVGMYVRRMLRRKGAFHPELTQQLLEVLREAPSTLSPLRQASSPVPVDSDSKLQLLRVEAVPLLEVEPAFAPDVAVHLNELVEERRRRSDLAKVGLHPTRTAVFTGPPGVGKTYAAKWLARELGVPLLTLDLAAVMSSYLGKTGANVRQVLQYAKGFECVLLLDEIDAIAKKRDDDADVGELKRLVNVLLQAIDEWPPGGLIIGATNHPNLLDPAVWRRFEFRIQFPLPTGDALEAIVRRHFAGAGELEDCWPSILAQVLDGSSASDVERFATRAKRNAAIYDKTLTESVLELTRPTVHDLDQQARIKVAIGLNNAGVSARQTHELTGVSRDTIRKHAKAGAA